MIDTRLYFRVHCRVRIHGFVSIPFESTWTRERAVTWCEMLGSIRSLWRIDWAFAPCSFQDRNLIQCVSLWNDTNKMDSMTTGRFVPHRFGDDRFEVVSSRWIRTKQNMVGSNRLRRCNSIDTNLMDSNRPPLQFPDGYESDGFEWITTLTL